MQSDTSTVVVLDQYQILQCNKQHSYTGFGCLFDFTTLYASLSLGCYFLYLKVMGYSLNNFIGINFIVFKMAFLCFVSIGLITASKVKSLQMLLIGHQSSL